MKKIILTLTAIFMCTFSYAQIITLEWIVDGQQYGNTTTCEYSGDVILPTAPTKYGYTFTGWTPGMYIELEYIQNSGSQKIDTGVTITNSKRFEIDVQLNSANPDENSIMGTGGGGDTNFVSIRAGNYFGSGADQNNFGFLKNDKHYFPGHIQKDANRHLFTIDLKNNKVKVDQYEETTDGTTNSSLTWWIGSYMGRTSSGFDWIGKYYGVKIYDNEELIHNFIPVKRITDNEVCLFDTITEKFFTNSGTGSFIAGPVVQ